MSLCRFVGSVGRGCVGVFHCCVVTLWNSEPTYKPGCALVIYLSRSIQQKGKRPPKGASAQKSRKTGDSECDGGLPGVPEACREPLKKLARKSL